MVTCPTEVILKSEYDEIIKELIEKLEATEKKGTLKFTKDCHALATECRFKKNLLEDLKEK